MADSKVTSLREASKELRRNFLERICEQIYSAAKSSPTKLEEYSTIIDSCTHNGGRPKGYNNHQETALLRNLHYCQEQNNFTVQERAGTIQKR